MVRRADNNHAKGTDNNLTKARGRLHLRVGGDRDDGALHNGEHRGQPIPESKQTDLVLIRC